MGEASTADTGAHPATALDETVHHRHRLGILTIASRARQADFGYLRETLGLTSGNLSTHLTVLEDAGLVRVEKGYAGRLAADLGQHHPPGPGGPGGRDGRAGAAGPRARRGAGHRYSRRQR